MDNIVETPEGAKVTEPRDVKFKRVVVKRVNNVLGTLKLIEQIAGSPNYKYEMNDVERMLVAIETAVERVRQSYILSLTRASAEDARHSFHF